MHWEAPSHGLLQEILFLDDVLVAVVVVLAYGPYYHLIEETFLRSSISFLTYLIGPFLSDAVSSAIGINSSVISF